jgi:hypothetical protein
MSQDPADSQPWRDAFDPVRSDAGLVQQAPWMSVVWPAFLAAATLEMLVFGVVDPRDLLVSWMPANADPWPRAVIYSAAFVVFWLVCMACSALTLVLAAPTKVQVNTPAD